METYAGTTQGEFFFDRKYFQELLQNLYDMHLSYFINTVNFINICCFQNFDADK